MFHETFAIFIHLCLEGPEVTQVRDFFFFKLYSKIKIKTFVRMHPVQKPKKADTNPEAPQNF